MRRRLLPVMRIVIALSIVFTYLFIFGNSLKTSAESNAISGPVSGTIQDIVDPEHTIPEETFSFYVRKSAHFTEFFLLGALWLLFFLSLPPRFLRFSPWLPPVLVLASAGLDELLQSFSDRTAALTDVLLDTVGGICGIAVTFLLSLLLRRIFKRKRSSHDT